MTETVFRRQIDDQLVVTMPLRFVTPRVLAGEMTPELMRFLHGAAEYAINQLQGDNAGKVLRRVLRAELWQIHDRAEGVEAMEPVHDCATCRDGLAAAAALLRSAPGSVVAIGALAYDQYERPGSPN